MKYRDLCFRGLLLSLCLSACSLPQAIPITRPSSAVTNPISNPSAAPIQAPTSVPSVVSSASPTPVPSVAPSVSPSPVPSAVPSASPALRPAGKLNVELNGFQFFNTYALQAELFDSENQSLSQTELHNAKNIQLLELSTSGLSTETAYQIQVSGLKQTDCLRLLTYRLKPVSTESSGLRQLSADLNQLAFDDFEEIMPAANCLQTYELSGEIEDGQSRPVSEARIKATVFRQGQPDYFQIVSTDDSGKYSLDNLPQQGLLLLTIDKSGFDSADSKYLYKPQLPQQKLNLDLKAE